MKISAHIVTYNSDDSIEACLEHLQKTSSIHVEVTDNASSDNTVSILENSGLKLFKNSTNLGFSAPHNRAIERAAERGDDFILILNPDCRLEDDAIEKMAEALAYDSRAAACTPKLYRANSNLKPISPEIIDACGMYMTPSIRHFDRGSGCMEIGAYQSPQYVFGGTGACLLLKISALKDLSLSDERLEIFDENFFAYREDADLGWRILQLGWRTLFLPEAVGYHVRHLKTKEGENLNRSQFSSEVNSLGVQNRFLLQLNNFSLAANFRCLPALLFRNLLVVGGVLVTELSSLGGLKNALKHSGEALQKNKQLASRRRLFPSAIGCWFSNEPYAEPALLKPKDQASTKNFKIAALVVAFRSGEELERLVDSLKAAKEDLPSWLELEICVIDNGGSMINPSADLTLVRNETNQGFAGALNAAAKKYSDVSAYLVLNPDIEINVKAISEMAQTLSQQEKLGATCPVLVDANSNPQLGFTVRRHRGLMATALELLFVHRLWPRNPWTVRLQMQDDPILNNYLNNSPIADSGEPLISAEQAVVVEQPAAACVLIKKRCFDELGGFDEHFWPAWFEDVDFFKRLSEAGWLSAVVAKARVSHIGGSSLRAIRAEDFARAWYANMNRFYKKHSSGIEYGVFRLVYTLGILIRASVAYFDGLMPGKRGPAHGEERLAYAKTLFRMITTPETENKKFAIKQLSKERTSLSGKIQVELTPALGGDSQSGPIRDEERNWREHFAHQLAGKGLELGPLHRPCPTHEEMFVDYVDRLSVADLRKHYPELAELPLVEPDILDDAETLNSVDEASYDFIIAAHIIEHTKNPIKSIENWCRVLKPGGKIYLIVPDKRHTFDKPRVRTSLEHLVLDYKRPCEERDFEHYLDYATYVGGKSGSEALEEAKSLLERDYSIHFHVFTPDDMSGMLEWYSENVHDLKILSGPCKSPGSDEFHYLLEKN